MEIRFRLAGLPDAMEIVQTRQKCWAATYRGIYSDAMIDGFDYGWHLDKEKRRLEKPNFRCYLVLDGERCAGYYSYQWRTEDGKFRLNSLYLLPEYQHRGLGRRIFAEVTGAAKQMGFSRMHNTCSPYNENACAFYRHMGGTVTQEDLGNPNRWEDAITFTYDLAK